MDSYECQSSHTKQKNYSGWILDLNVKATTTNL